MDSTLRNTSSTAKDGKRLDAKLVYADINEREYRAAEFRLAVVFSLLATFDDLIPVPCALFLLAEDRGMISRNGL